MSIVKKLDQILTHVDGVLSADREQNVKILIRQIKDELASNNDKTMADLLNVIKPKKYVVFYYDVEHKKRYVDDNGGTETIRQEFENDMKSQIQSSLSTILFSFNNEN